MLMHLLYMAIAGFAVAALEAILRGPGGRYHLFTLAIVAIGLSMPPIPGGGLFISIVVPLMARRYSRRFLAVLIPRRADKLTEPDEVGEAAAA